MYSRSRGGLSFLPGGATPLTVGLLIAYVIIYVVNLSTNGVLGQWLAFDTSAFPAHFWTLFTWPLVGAGDPLSVLFAIGWGYWFGGSMERAWGTRDFGVFFLLTNIIAAIGYWLGSLMLGHGTLAGLWIAIAPAAVAWALTNRGEVMSLYFIPIPGILWGVIGVVTAWFYAGPYQRNPLLGLTALAGCIAAYVYATKGRYSYEGYRANPTKLRLDRDEDYAERSARPRSLDDIEPKRPFNVMRWWRERQEKKRLEEIFRRSGFTDEDERR